MKRDGWAVWITGLPGSGKSTITRELKELLIEKGVGVQVLRLDTFRKTLVPHPKYTEEEREVVYNTLILMAKLLTDNGVNVVIDATAHRMRWREKGRKTFKKFFEVYIKCPLEVCMEREANRKDNLVVSNLYKKALKRLEMRRKLGEKEISYRECGENLSPLGQMIGIDVPYEFSPRPEVIIDSEKLGPHESALLIIRKLEEET